MGRRLISRGRGQQIGDGRRYARMRQMIIGGVAPPPPPPPFAEGCEYAETSALTLVSTNTYVNHLTLAPPGAIGAGNYFLGAYGYYAQNGNTFGDAQLQITVDGGEVEVFRGRTGGNGNDADDMRCVFACNSVIALAAGVHIYELNVRVGLPVEDGNSASVFWAALELWSFNT